MGFFSLFRRKRQEARVSGSFWEPSPAQPVTTMIGGRRYLAGSASYVLAKDALEIKRLDFQHHLLYQFCKKHFEAPLEGSSLRRILDVGTGTGIWAHTLACQFPRVEVIGLDIEPVSTVEMPPNYHFVQGNILHGLPFPDQHFDYVHQRLLGSAIPTARWPGVVRELVRVTAFGAYIELLEIGSYFLNQGPALSQVLAWAAALGDKKGIDFSALSQIGNWLQDAGLFHVQQKTLCVPVGSWDKDGTGNKKSVGELMAIDTFHALSSMKGIMCKSLDLNPRTFDAVLAALPDEWNFHKTEVQIFNAYGRRV